jgi:hypothetical protein
VRRAPFGAGPGNRRRGFDYVFPEACAAAGGVSNRLLTIINNFLY